MALQHRLEVIREEDYEEFHEGTLKILKETGVKFLHDEVLALFKKHGAKIDGNIVYFPRALVEKNLATVPSTFRWKARNDAHSVTVGDGFLVQPIAGTVKMHDMDHGVRPATLRDIGNIQKIYQ